MSSDPLPMTKGCLDAAIKYEELGLSVLPINPQTKKPYVPTWKEYQRVPADTGLITCWWAQWPNANIAVITGAVSDIMTLDFDSEEALRAWEAKFDTMPQGLYYKTGKGYHYWFKYSSYGQGNKTKIFGDVDIRGEGGYVIVPPSVHGNGNTYTWGHINPLEDGLDELSDMPEEMLTFCKTANKTGDLPAREQTTANQFTDFQKTENPDPSKPSRRMSVTTLEWMQRYLMGVGKGQRNAVCAKICGFYVREFHLDGVPREEMFSKVFPLIVEWNQRNQPPLPEKELQTTLQSIINRHSFDNLSEAIGIPIYSIEIIERLSRGRVYKIYTAANQAFTATATELCNLNLFRPKFLQATGRFIMPMKQKVWYGIMEPCLRDATIITECIETQPQMILKDWISEVAVRNKNTRFKLSNYPVVIDNEVHITVQAAYRHMQNSGSYRVSWDEVGAMLKDIGFKFSPKTLRVPFGTGFIKTWRIPLNILINSDSEHVDED